MERVMDNLKRDLAEAKRRLTSMEHRLSGLLQDVQGLSGTFASIERHMVTLFEREAEMRAWREDIELRVKALERKPPAA
jgi:hypothetical protein